MESVSAVFYTEPWREATPHLSSPFCSASGTPGVAGCRSAAGVGRAPRKHRAWFRCQSLVDEPSLLVAASCPRN